MTRLLRSTALLLLLPGAAAAQQGSFAITRGADTVASESVTLDSAGFTGTLIRGKGANSERIKYQVTVVDGTAPLVELGVWRGDDPAESKARQNARVIFKEDSVAIDEANDKTGVSTRLFETQRGALPYLNLSTAFLELATRRAAGRDSVAVPFFNLSGGQTLAATVKRISADSVSLALGRIELRLKVDPRGAILGGAVPAQGLVIARGGVP